MWTTGQCRGIVVGGRRWISARMYGSLDLGVSGSAAVALIIFAHVIAAVIRRRWTLAQARREEVVHLVKLASEETARAELEASIGYLPETKMSMDVCEGRSLGVPSRFECAVCHRPTNTRCSRCKAVRYCSGTCQIIHWRQGHKDECCDPQVNHQNKLQERNPSDLQAENLKSLPNTVVTIKRSHGKLIAANLEEQSSGHKLSTYGSSNDALVEPKTLLDSCEAKHCPGSSVDSSTGRSIHPDPSVNPSEEALLSYYHDKTAEEFSLGNCSCPEVIADPGNIGFPLVGSGDSSLSMNILSHTASLRKQMFTHSSKDIEYSSNDCSVSDFVQSNHGKNVEFSQCPDEGRKSCSEFDTASIRISSNNPEQNGISKARAIKDNSCVNSCDECMKESILKDCRCFGAEKSGFVPGRKSADGWLHNSRTFRSNSVSVANHVFSSGRGHSDSDASFTKVDNASTVPSKLSKTAVLVSSSLSDLRTSFRRAAHHLKLSQSLRGSMTMAASELVFPFEFFVKLYNSDKVDMKPFGLFNCGNSCFANAVLQCLLHTRPLISYHYQGLHSGTCPRGQWCFTCEFENLILRGKQGESPVSPVGILSNIKKIGSHFGHGREEDAHEFLSPLPWDGQVKKGFLKPWLVERVKATFFLDFSLEIDLLTLEKLNGGIFHRFCLGPKGKKVDLVVWSLAPGEAFRYAIDAMQSASTNGAVGAGKYSEDASLIQLTFGGYLLSEVKCMKCQAKSEQLERIMDLTVEIHGDIGSLEEALRQFTATEVLDGDNRYNCSRCKSFERAKKRLSVFQAPNVLTIALKRFQLGKFGKLNKPVSFPALLDLSPYASTVDRSALYSLYAVVVHEDVNNFTYSGHYICYVKSLKGNWYLINDREVTPVEFERVLKQNAYMLFYARNSPQAPGLIRNKTSQVFALAKSRSNETQASAQSCGESAAKENSRSMARWRQEHLYRTSRHCSSFQPSDLINGSLHFCHRDSSSDSLSLSWSDESSWSTESTRDSTSTDDLSDYLFGGSQPMRCSGALHSSSEDSNYITYLPSTSAKSFYHEPGEGLDVKGNHSLKSSFLYCDRTNHSSKLRDNYRGRETECSSICGQKSSFLLRSSTVRERRHQTLY